MIDPDKALEWFISYLMVLGLSTAAIYVTIYVVLFVAGIAEQCVAVFRAYMGAMI